MRLNEEIIELLEKENCHIVGFADLHELSSEVRQNFAYGIVFALSYSKEAMKNNMNGDMQKYHEEWKAINQRLNELALMTERYLVKRGFKAWAKIPSTVIEDQDLRTVLPHKTVATIAGLGWIGRCAMLVTPQVGSALRLAVVLTNAPLDCGIPVIRSMCLPNCRVCAEICPEKAPLGIAWEAGLDRDDFFDAHSCREAAHARALEKLSIEGTICGQCMSNCPFTRQGLGY
jgi:epoxyqueuosine reductase QueG